MLELKDKPLGLSLLILIQANLLSNYYVQHFREKKEKIFYLNPNIKHDEF